MTLGSRRIGTLILGLTILSAGCGDDAADAGPTGASGGALEGCIVASASDGETASIAVIDVSNLAVATDVTSIHTDTAMFGHGSALYVLNRLGADSLQRVDGDNAFTTAYELSLGNGTNPQMLAIADDSTAYAPRLTGDVARIDLTVTSGDPVTATASLPIPDFSGTTAEAILAWVHAETVYVVTQGLDDAFACAPDAHSTVYAFDFDLEPKNVFGDDSELALQTCNAGGVVVVGSTAYVGSLGGFRSFGSPTDDGAIEAIDLEAGASLGVIATEEDFGGQDIFAMSGSEDGQGIWVTTADDSFAMSLRHLDLETTSVTEPVWTGDIWGVVEVHGKLFIGERDESAFGVVVLDPTTHERLDGGTPIDTGLPPRSLTFLDTDHACAP